MLDLDKIIAKQTKDYTTVNNFFNEWRIDYLDCHAISYTRNNINVGIYRKDLRNYFIKDSAVIYLPFIYRYFKIKLRI